MNINENINSQLSVLLYFYLLTYTLHIAYVDKLLVFTIWMEYWESNSLQTGKLWDTVLYSLLVYSTYILNRYWGKLYWKMMNVILKLEREKNNDLYRGDSATLIDAYIND